MSNSKLTGDVLYVTSKERSINYKWEDNCSKLNSRVQVVSIDDVNPQIDLYNQGGAVMMDTILVKHPFIPEKYIDVNAAEDALTKTKLDCLGIISNLLGVKEYETTFAIEEDSKREVDANGNMTIKAVESNVQVKIQEGDSRSGKYYRHEKFNSKLSAESYSKAIQEAKKFGLCNDESINYLIMNRNPKMPNNMLTEQNVKVELYRELNSLLDIAFSLKVSKIFNLTASYSEKISHRKKITIETSLIF